MSTEEPWEPWAEAMRAANIGNPRNGRPSWTQLAHRAGVSTTTVTNAVTGKTAAEAPTVQALAKALRVKPETISGWLGVPTVGGPYVPPDEASLLATHERDAIDQLIRAIARGREEAHDGTAKTQAGPDVTFEAGESFDPAGEQEAGRPPAVPDQRPPRGSRRPRQA